MLTSFSLFLSLSLSFSLFLSFSLSLSSLSLFSTLCLFSLSSLSRLQGDKTKTPEYYPTSLTCFFRITLSPWYESKEQLESQLMTSMANGDMDGVVMRWVMWIGQRLRCETSVLLTVVVLNLIDNLIIDNNNFYIFF